MSTDLDTNSSNCVCVFVWVHMHTHVHLCCVCVCVWVCVLYVVCVRVWLLKYVCTCHYAVYVYHCMCHCVCITVCIMSVCVIFFPELFWQSKFVMLQNQRKNIFGHFIISQKPYQDGIQWTRGSWGAASGQWSIITLMAIVQSAVAVHSLRYGHGSGAAAQPASTSREQLSCWAAIQPIHSDLWGTSQPGHVFAHVAGGWSRGISDHQSSGRFCPHDVVSVLLLLF